MITTPCRASVVQVSSAIDQPAGAWRWAPLYAGGWLIFLAQPFADALRLPDRLRGGAAVALLLAFAVLYVHCWSTTREHRRRGETVPVPRRYALLGAAAALTVGEASLVGESAIAMTTFLTVLLMFLLPPGVRVPATAVAIGLTAAAVYLVPGWSRDPDVLVAPVLTAVIIWSIVQIFDRNAQLARANERLAELAVAEERARFARDLHDLLGHSLTLLAMKAELAGRLVTLQPDRAQQEIAEVERLARDALGDVRAAVSGYRRAGLAVELSSARAVLDAAGIRAELPTAVDDVPGERRELLGWAVREGVTNVVRHSRATRCRIILDRDGVEILDDGRGADPMPSPGEGDPAWVLGSGLRGLRERAEACGASVVVDEAPDGGFRLRVGW